VILQGWFIDLTGEDHFVGAVGLCGIQVVGAFRERGIENILLRLPGWIGTIPWLIIAPGYQYRDKDNG
jgi:hypothetical protein